MLAMGGHLNPSTSNAAVAHPLLKQAHIPQGDNPTGAGTKTALNCTELLKNT